MKQRKKEVLSLFAVALNRIRESNNVSQVRLAEKLERSQSFTSQMETGKSEPTLTDLYVMAKIFSCPVEDFFPSDVRSGTAKPPDQTLQWEDESVSVKTLIFNKKTA